MGMFKSIRRALAGWLCPDMARDAKRHWYLRNKLDEARTWLGYDFPVVDAAIFWALVSDQNHFRSRDQADVSPVPAKPWLHSIDDVREHFRRTYLPAKDPGPGAVASVDQGYIVAVSMALLQHGVPEDVISMLVHGDGRGTVDPGALPKAIAAGWRAAIAQEASAIVAWLRQVVRDYPTHPLIAFIGDPFSQDAEIMCERIAEAVEAGMHRLPRNAGAGT